MEPTENQEDILEPQQEQAEGSVENQEPDLTGVEVVSNGETVDLIDNPEDKGEDASTAEHEDTLEDPQGDFKAAQSSMASVKTLLESKGVNYNALENEYAEQGGLSEASYQALAKAGYPKEAVDAVISGWQATADQFVEAVISNVGGNEAYERLTQFVTGQGDQAINTFNTVVQSGDYNVITSYLNGIKAQMEAKYGTSNPTLTGSSATGGASKGFTDQTEMIKAMSDPRYGRDAKYTREVEKRIISSKIFE